MENKPYQKPEFKRIALRPEERLAVCEYYWKTGLAGRYCHDVYLYESSPATCLIETVPVGSS